MKKLIISLLALVYLAATCEAKVYLHYCMGKRAGISMNPSGNCTRCGMKKKDSPGSCCKDEPRTIASDKSQKLPDPAFRAISVEKSLPVFFASSFDERTETGFRNAKRLSGDSPPLQDKVPRYIKNRIFLI